RPRRPIWRGPGKRMVEGKDLRLADEVRHIQKCAARHDRRIVTLGQLIFFSTETGDAWLLDWEDGLAAPLARDGDPKPIHIGETDPNLSPFYSIAQIEYCRNFIFKRNFPIHKLFERSCELGLWRLTAHKISEIFGQRLHAKCAASSPPSSNRSSAAIISRLLQARVAQRGLLQQSQGLWPQEGLGQSRRRAGEVPG